MKAIFRISLFVITFSINACSNDNSFKNVGDIPFDESIDNPNFTICNEKIIKQYYVRNSLDESPVYKGEKRALENSILGQYNYPISKEENGYLTIRFIVNCKGETGRFRMEEMDFDYQAIRFHKEISEQLFEIVKNLNAWIPRRRGERTYDFYQYLTFKIKEGQIVKILP